jgi:hypothetical protein
MTIKLEKTTEVNLDPTMGDLGMEIIWYWVRAYDDNNTIKLQKVYREEAMANTAYTGIIAYYEQHQTVEPTKEIVAQHKIIPHEEAIPG